MDRQTVVCFGDSNTYGYDPRSWLGGRYQAENRWCDLVAEQLGCTVINLGENGRTIPGSEWEYRSLEQCLEENAPVDSMIVMLGSNDILLAYRPDINEISERMEQLVIWTQCKWPDMKLILLVPPQIRLPDRQLCDMTDQLADKFIELAVRHEVLLCDVRNWQLPLAYDGVHLTEQAHHIFADCLIRFLKQNHVP